MIYDVKKTLKRKKKENKGTKALRDCQEYAKDTLRKKRCAVNHKRHMIDFGCVKGLIRSL